MENSPPTATQAQGHSEQPDKLTWGSAMNSLNPWSKERDDLAAGSASAPMERKIARDHLTTPLYGQSTRSYPEGCPKLPVRWFHAVDVPKRHTQSSSKAGIGGTEKQKQDVKPKKFTQFSKSDSARIEKEYQALLEAEENWRLENDGFASSGKQQQKTALSEAEAAPPDNSSPVPVNEDFLFDVMIPNRELYPVYWAGPVYEVRRGTWFYQDGSSLRPCEENLAAQIEEGYLKMKPWRDIGMLHCPDNSKFGFNSTLKELGKAKSKELSYEEHQTVDKRGATLKHRAAAAGSADSSATEATSKCHRLGSYRLFGAYMASTVTYEDVNTAWLTSDGVLSWVTNSVYERFSGGGYMGGMKLVRGYTEQTKESRKEASSQPNATTKDSKSRTEDKNAAQAEGPGVGEDAKQDFMRRKLSHIINEGERRAPKTDDEAQKFNEEEMQHGYSTQRGESQNRDIQHLILVTHGIGQRLSLRMQSVNFIHDVNILRKTLKAVYADSPSLRSTNEDEGEGPGNCRVQVLPVCWRHKLDFPKQRRSKLETDLGDAHSEDCYPSLEDITVDGVAFARSLISDLALDVLLYQSSYREEIAKTVTDESNRIVRLFRSRNPQFKGKIHVIGHSLGSAILFDILCRQESERKQNEDRLRGLHFWPSAAQGEGQRSPQSSAAFQFSVDDMYCLGSPIGLFQMLNGRTIAARATRRPKQQIGSNSIESERSASTVSSPDVKQLFNIFYPSDPISYRIEPLIASAMAKLKPHNVPYTKKSLFGAVRPQGLTEIGSMVGQGFSGLWSSLSTGLSSNFLSKSLRATAHDVQQAEGYLSDTKGLKAKGDDLENEVSQKGKARKPASGEQATSSIHNLSAISDAELETLYSGFYTSGRSHASSDDSEQEEGYISGDTEGQKLRMAQRKVWDLNRNGRIDFMIQEGALDFNPISTIASHIGYWADEDVNHFILTQLLSQSARMQS